MIILFQDLTTKDKKTAIERLIRGGTPSQDFFVMVILSILTATLGLLINNSAVIIGSMLIAPILYPILSLSLGIIMSNPELIGRAFWTLIKSVVFGIFVATLATLLFHGEFSGITSEISSRAHPSLPYLAIAIAAGFAGTLALVKPQLNETLPGIAISVALIPPIAVVGIGIAKFNWTLISGSLLLFLLNLFGVIFASMITFSLMNFYLQRKDIAKSVKREDTKIEKAREKAGDTIKRINY